MDEIKLRALEKYQFDFQQMIEITAFFRVFGIQKNFLHVQKLKKFN